MIKASCNKCGSLLFDCQDFDSFNKPSPVVITCAGCDTVYRVTQGEKGSLVLMKKGGTKKRMIEHYG